ncbi:hypothetical protein KMF95_004114 [Salmonella enterica]|nr:hypothetical protein [Salmonella enterica]EHO7808226.1 hypothetical protein [Salmonella enterica]
MTPTDFIQKHITEALVAEGSPDQVAAGGGAMWPSITTGAVHRQAGREACSLIAFSVPDSGLSDKQQAQNATQRKSRIREESPYPACSDFVCSYLQRNQLLQEPFHEKQYQ